MTNVSPAAPVVPAAPAVDVTTPASAPALDAKHLWALGMIETGNNDSEVGGAGEVSRYQVLPAVWRAYSTSSRYTDPGTSAQVARAHWNYLAASFQTRAGRTPDDFDMYVLWNTGCSFYATKQFSPAKVPRTIQDRAQRFVNLVNRKNDDLGLLARPLSAR